MTVFRGVCRENIIKAVPRQTQAISNSFIKNIVKGKHHWITPVSANQAWTDCLGAQNFWDKLILRVCTFCLLERYNEWHQSLHFKGLHVEKTIKIWKKRKKERKKIVNSFNDAHKENVKKFFEFFFTPIYQLRSSLSSNVITDGSTFQEQR